MSNDLLNEPVTEPAKKGKAKRQRKNYAALHEAQRQRIAIVRDILSGIIEDAKDADTEAAVVTLLRVAVKTLGE